MRKFIVFFYGDQRSARSARRLIHAGITRTETIHYPDGTPAVIGECRPETLQAAIDAVTALPKYGAKFWVDVYQD